MIVAGFGLRAVADDASLRALFAQVEGATLTALAAPADKVDHVALQALAQRLGLPLLAIPLDQLLAQTTKTRALKQPARYGAGSVAEATALAACGPAAWLIQPRQISPCGKATFAIAEGPDV